MIHLTTSWCGFLLPWACCTDSALFPQCTASLSHYVSCSRPRTERLRTFSSKRWSYLWSTKTSSHSQNNHNWEYKLYLSLVRVWITERLRWTITSLYGSGHSDEEAGTVIQRKVDVEDVVCCDFTCSLQEGGSPHPLMSDHSCLRQTFQREKKTS